MPEASEATPLSARLVQLESKSTPIFDQSNIRRITDKHKVLTPKTRRKLIKQLLKDLPAITEREIFYLIKGFMKSQGYFEKNPMIDYTGQLKWMVDKNEITRIKIMGKWRYCLLWRDQ